MNFKDTFKNKTILIPLLQRDYVQGSEESIIGPFLDYLLNHKCDLNYIYGYSEKGSFVPVDGQQRLTTLWLLYLYIHSRNQLAFETELRFNSREFAQDFSSRLKEKLPALLKNLKAEENLGAVISEQYWFISSWQKNATVSNMLKTLSYIHSRINDENLSTATKRLLGDDCPVSFSFLDMNESNKLDDDIYVKMNGRGRPLSQFENLKSWMDEKVQSLSFANDWKRYMDNRWTNTFWQNRNKQHEHPEEIDDEQLHCFANIMALFHIKYPHILRHSILCEAQKYRESLVEYLHSKNEKFEDLKVDEKETEEIFIRRIADELISQLMNGKVPPLVWFDRLNMMPWHFFRFAYTSLNRLSEVSEQFNSLKLHFRDDKAGVTPIYSLSMTNGTFATTLPLLYALIRRPKKATELTDWMRITRNLTLNTTIRKEEIFPILRAIDRFSHKCRKNNIYTVLKASDTRSILDFFNEDQISEEIMKAGYESNFRKLFAVLENTRFFEGMIRCMFAYLPAEEFSIENFKKYSDTLTVLFPGGKQGISPTFDDKNHYFRRCLMSYPPYYFGVRYRSYWCFCDALDYWRRYVRQQLGNTDAIKAFLKDMAECEITSERLHAKISRRVEAISKNYFEDIKIPDYYSYRFNFIHHPGIWDYMGDEQVAKWDDGKPWQILLKTSSGNSSNKMDLRIYGLYLDYCHNAIDHNGWSVNIWPKGITGMYFEKRIEFAGTKRTIAIDVFFNPSISEVDKAAKNYENWYQLNLFTRIHSDEIEDQIEDTKSVIYNRNQNFIEQIGLKMNAKDGRLWSGTFSREGIIDLIKLLQTSLN